MTGKLAKREIGENVVTAEFAVPADFTFQAGEYVQIILPNAEKHYFSIASSPTERGIVRIATRPSASGFKKTLQELPLGSEIEIRGPWGDMLFPASAVDGPKNATKELVFIAGGIGITPFLSMIHYATEEKLAYKMQLLHFGDLDIFHHDLEQLAHKNPNFTFQHIYQSISSDILKANLGDPERIFFVAGPPGFVNETLNLLAALNIPPARIVSESYTGY